MDARERAALGLRSRYGGTHSAGQRVVLRRVRLDRGGYAPDGSYFGVDIPLWHVEDAAGRGDVDFFVRAYDKEAAKAKISAAYPTSKRRG